MGVSRCSHTAHVCLCNASEINRSSDGYYLCSWTVSNSIIIPQMFSYCYTCSWWAPLELEPQSPSKSSGDAREHNNTILLLTLTDNEIIQDDGPFYVIRALKSDFAL